jgi:hypothetical protein
MKNDDKLSILERSIIEAVLENSDITDIESEVLISTQK